MHSTITAKPRTLDVPESFILDVAKAVRANGKAVARSPKGETLRGTMEIHGSKTVIVIRGYTVTGDRDGTWVVG